MLFRSSESGDTVAGKAQAIGVMTPSAIDPGVSTTPGAYESFSNSRSRATTDLLFPDGPEWVKLRDWFNNFRTILDPMMIVTGDLVPWARSLTDIDFERYWRGLTVPKITGLKQIMASPLSLVDTGAQMNLANSQTFADFLIAFLAVRDPRLLPLAGGFHSSVGGSMIVGLNFGMNPFPAFTYQTTFGSQGMETLQASHTGYSYSQQLEQSWTRGDASTVMGEGQMKRVVQRRPIESTAADRVRGSEVMWQDELVDVVTGTIPLGFTLPATASRLHYRTTDDAVRVRLGSGIGVTMSVDIWFDTVEDVVRDDY